MTIILYCGHPIVLEGKKTCIHHVYFQIINVLKMIPYVVLTTRFRAAAKVCIGQNFILVFFSFFLLSISKFRILAYLEDLMVFNATFNNFSVISWWSVVFGRGSRSKPPTCRKLLTNLITYCCTLLPNRDSNSQHQ